MLYFHKHFYLNIHIILSAVRILFFSKSLLQSVLNWSQSVQLLTNQYCTGGNIARIIYAPLIVCVREYILSPVRYYGFFSMVIGYGSTSTILCMRLTLSCWYHCKNFTMASIYLRVQATSNSSPISSSLILKISCSSLIILSYQG